MAVTARPIFGVVGLGHIGATGRSARRPPGTGLTARIEGAAEPLPSHQRDGRLGR